MLCYGSIHSRMEHVMLWIYSLGLTFQRLSSRFPFPEPCDSAPPPHPLKVIPLVVLPLVVLPLAVLPLAVLPLVVLPLVVLPLAVLPLVFFKEIFRLNIVFFRREAANFLFNLFHRFFCREAAFFLSFFFAFFVAKIHTF